MSDVPNSGEPNSDGPITVPDLTVFNPAPVGVALLRGPEHILVYTNDTYRHLFGTRQYGVPIRQLFTDLKQQQILDLLDVVYETGAPVVIGPESPMTLRDEHGVVRDRWFSISLSCSARQTSRGDPEGSGEHGVLVVVVDVTGEVTAKEVAREQAEQRRRTLLRYQSLVAVSVQMVWVADRDGRVLQLSSGWHRVTGMPEEKLLGWGWLDSAHPRDRAGLAKAWRRVVRTEPDSFEHRYRIRRRDGTYRHCSLRVVPIREHGDVTEWVGACADIEDQWLRERRQDLLGQASIAVSGPHRPEPALEAVGRVLVPEPADACGIYLLPEGVRPQAAGPLMTRHVATVTAPPLPSFPSGGELRGTPPGSLFDEVVRRGRTALRRAGPDGFAEADIPPGAAAWARAGGIREVALLPVVVLGEIRAVVALYAADREPFSAEEISLVEEVLDRTAPAFGRLLELRRTRRVALALQESLLGAPPEVPGLDIVARYASSAAANEVGGDWYDSFVTPDGATALIIGDVSGHDLQASVTMSKMRNMLRGIIVDRRMPPGDVLRRLDRATSLLGPEEGTVTCVYARIEETAGGGRQLSYSVAGHPPPLLVTADGRARFLEDAQDLLLGGLKPHGLLRASATEPLEPGSTVLLYTDGLVEQPAEDLDQGLERLRRRAAGLARAPLSTFCDELLQEACTVSGDDIALLAARLPLTTG
ncbi:serine/threonine protein phosphatase [Streptomyces sp. F-3]|jgi:PAS domain S-box-containing protein|uniref:PAS domain-containing protein n=1 Tax=Streptomyces thermogriseus TaxID=75292 RepID=A0ABP4DFK2_9ACTN|nr:MULTISPECIES: SpoIIE family protein phosphatase [Streptomyces]GAT79668.1 serine/threonine protein phosphatase [Streptomyces sp. F-3]